MNYYGLEMLGIESAADIINANAPQELYYNRHTGCVRCYDVDVLNLAYPAECEDDAWIYCGTFRSADPLKIADRIALHVYIASDPEYKVPDLPPHILSRGKQMRVLNVEQGAYGDWITYEDGHTVYERRD